jgi:hypothetical protein
LKGINFRFHDRIKLVPAGFAPTKQKNSSKILYGAHNHDWVSTAPLVVFACVMSAFEG